MVSLFDHTLRFIIILLATSFHLNAQSFNTRYNFKQLNVQNGLVQNIVYHFLQDSHGYLWIGTHNGITLYDGTRTINFLHNERDTTSIGGMFITSILEDSSQQIWIGNESGIDLYNRANNCFSHFGVDRPDGTKENAYCVILGFVSATELWFLETKTRSIRSLNTKTKKTFFISELNASHAMLYKGSGQTFHIWSAYDKGTIHQIYKNSKLISHQTYFSGKKDILKYPELEVIHILQQNDSIAWLSTNKGLLKLNFVSNKYSIFSQWENQVVNELRYAALLPKKEQIWVGSGPAGIYVFDINSNRFIENFRNNKLDPFSICSDNIVSLYFDHTDNIWCGSYGQGSSYARTENIFFKNHISRNEMVPWHGNNHVLWIGSDNEENIWCMMNAVSGFWVLDKDLKVRKHLMPLLENGTQLNGYMNKLLFDKNDNIWCTSNKGLYKYHISSNKLIPVKYDLINDEVQGSIWIRDIIQLNDHSIIFSTFWGLYRLTIEAAKPVVKPITFLKPGSYSGFGVLFQDKAGLVYVKSLGDSIYILKPKEGGKYDLHRSLYFMPEIHQYFSEGDANIYIASSNGLYCINSNTFEITKEEVNQRLPSFNVSSVFKKNNKYWVFGEKGLYFFDEKNKQEKRYTVEDGLPTNEFSLAALVYTSDHRCVAGSNNGLVSFSPNQLKYSTYSPRPQLTRIYINDTLYTSVPNPNEVKKINLSFRENTFSFDFSTISFNNIADYSFEYMLDGYDETWIKSGAANYTRYSKIPPGKYAFNLRVIDNQGKISPYSKSVEIQIAKSFWQTNFFLALLAALIVFTGGLFLKWYSNQKIKKQKREFEKQQLVEKERTRIATDMHDDLGAGLSRIKFLSETIGIKKQTQQPIEDEISKIREYSHDMIDKMGEIVWALNEKNDSLSDLLSYTRVYAMEYLSQNGIQCTVKAPEHLPGDFVSGEFRRNVYLTIKETLHNIVKHSQASEVIIGIHTGEKLEILIQDNGIGFDKKNIRPFSNGLANMEKRMREIGGELLILSEKGTTVKITIPIEK